MRPMDRIGTVWWGKILPPMLATSPRIIFSSMRGRLRFCCTKLVDFEYAKSLIF